MRDLVPSLPALMLPASAPAHRSGSLAADVPGLVSDVERRFTALEGYCHAVGDVQAGDPEFDRLDRLVAEAVSALAEAPSRNVAGIVAKARALIECPAIEEEYDRADRVGSSLARDVVRLLGAPSPHTGGRHGS